MATKQDILDKIASDPAQALKDIETLKKQLMADRLILKGKESLIRYFAEQAERYWRRYHEVRKALIQARLLVKELKKIQGY